jgi:hypothetical protein
MLYEYVETAEQQQRPARASWASGLAQGAREEGEPQKEGYGRQAVASGQRPGYGGHALECLIDKAHNIEIDRQRHVRREVRNAHSYTQCAVRTRSAKCANKSSRDGHALTALSRSRSRWWVLPCEHSRGSASCLTAPPVVAAAVARSAHRAPRTAHDTPRRAHSACAPRTCTLPLPTPQAATASVERARVVSAARTTTSSRVRVRADTVSLEDCT